MGEGKFEVLDILMNAYFKLRFSKIFSGIMTFIT